MMSKLAAHTVLPFPRIRLPMVDGGRMARQKHTVHGLVEFDVTLAREAIRQHKLQTGETLSFTAFIIACLAQAIDVNKRMHAYRDWRNRLILFDDVDVNTLFEVEADGKKTIRPHILRSVNKKTFRELHEEIRAFQREHKSSREAKFIDWFVLLPGRAAAVLLGAFQESALAQGILRHRDDDRCGDVRRWRRLGYSDIQPYPPANPGRHCQEAGVVEDRIQVREYLSVTVSFDHDIIDGAPARFTQRLKEIESSYSLCD